MKANDCLGIVFENLSNNDVLMCNAIGWGTKF
jgi:hypothetical protein